MVSNVYTKNEILQTLASKGYFIDAYTLDTFFNKWNIEAIFEDEQGSEFFDKNTLEFVLNNLFTANDNQNMSQNAPQQNVKEQTTESSIDLMYPKSQQMSRAQEQIKEQIQGEESQQVQAQVPQQEFQQAPLTHLQYTMPQQPQAQQVPPQMYQQMPQVPPQMYQQMPNMQFQAPPQMQQVPQGGQASQAPFFQASQTSQAPIQNFGINDAETRDVLNNISLSDGSLLINKLDSDLNIDIAPIEPLAESNQQSVIEDTFSSHKKRTGLLEGAIQQINEQQASINKLVEKIEEVAIEAEATPPPSPLDELNEIIPSFEERAHAALEGKRIPPPDMEQNEGQHSVSESQQDELQAQVQEQEVSTEESKDEPVDITKPVETTIENNDNGDFDDITLLSDSLEAQEKFREYVMSEFAKKQDEIQQLQQQNNEFKLDISERTINMIARTMARKIAKHVSTICSADAKNNAQYEIVKEENQKLEQKNRDLEAQNKKLKLLLAESNKNLNSYKPLFFGFYRKVPPEQ